MEMNEKKYMVFVRCMTYNHEKYIADAMKGFVMQQTTFPFVCVIVDDASTDKNVEMIMQFVYDNFDFNDEICYEKEMSFGHVAFSRNRNNKQCYFAVILLNENHYQQGKYKSQYFREWKSTSKYVAICEGDDYWTDPLKLQKQVDFLEAHPDFSMCIHGADVKNESTREIWAKCETIETREYFSKDFFPDWTAPTASILYKNEMVSKYPLVHYEWFVPTDIVYLLRGTHTGRVWGMSEHMSVYRMNNGSLMAAPETDESRAKMCKHYEALMLNFPQVDKSYCRHYIASYNYSKFRNVHGVRNKIRHLYIAVKFSPKYVMRKFLRIR